MICGFQKRALAEKAARKRMLASVGSANALRKVLSKNLAARERLRIQRQQAVQEKLRKGLAGQRLGKHKVPEGEVIVQLGDELSESLRALKVRSMFFRPKLIEIYTGRSLKGIFSAIASSACSNAR